MKKITVDDFELIRNTRLTDEYSGPGVCDLCENGCVRAVVLLNGKMICNSCLHVASEALRLDMLKSFQTPE